MEEISSGMRFDQAAEHLPTRLKAVLHGLPRAVKTEVMEIRLRVDRPVSLTCTGGICWFVDEGSMLHNVPGACFTVTREELEESVLTMSSYSVHSHQNEMRQGFIHLRGGHRAGICGTAVTDGGGEITTVRDITSVNLRVARDVRGAADEIVRRVFSGRVSGALIAGVPASGKTTILRDLARQLSGGGTGRYLRVAVVDERCEIGAVCEGVPQNDLGPCCDILSGYPKGEGILCAVRTLSPQVIICDEIGGDSEVTGMLDGLHCGVKLVASAHARTLEELLSRRQIVRLLTEGAFEAVVMLGDAETPGRIDQIIQTGELRYEGGRFIAHRPILFNDGDYHGVELVRPGPRA